MVYTAYRLEVLERSQRLSCLSNFCSPAGYIWVRAHFYVEVILYHFYNAASTLSYCRNKAHSVCIINNIIIPLRLSHTHVTHTCKYDSPCRLFTFSFDVSRTERGLYIAVYRTSWIFSCFHCLYYKIRFFGAFARAPRPTDSIHSIYTNTL